MPTPASIQQSEPPTSSHQDGGAAGSSSGTFEEEVSESPDDEEESDPGEPPLDWKRYVPASCNGTQVDLLQTLEDCTCRFPEPPTPDGRYSPHLRCEPAAYRSDLSTALSVRLVPREQVVRPGATVRVDVILENLTNARLPVVFRVHPSYETSQCSTLIEVRDASGKDVTCTGITGGGTGPRGDSLVVLHPRGRAFLSVPWRAATVHGAKSPTSAGSAQFTAVPLPAGAYTLSYELHFAENLKVTPQQRRPTVTITVVGTD